MTARRPIITIPLDHMYAEQAGNKGDYLNRAIENLRLA